MNKVQEEEEEEEEEEEQQQQQQQQEEEQEEEQEICDIKELELMVKVNFRTIKSNANFTGRVFGPLRSPNQRTENSWLAKMQ